jgi:hypothetical protein
MIPTAKNDFHEAGFSTPHGERGTGFQPLVEYRSDIQVGIRRKALGIFPVFGEKEPLDCVRRLFALDSGSPA